MKQYLLLCDETSKSVLETCLSGVIQFLEVEGMNLNGQNQYNLLLTPVLNFVTPADIMPDDSQSV